MNDRCHTCELLVRRDTGEAPLWDSIARTRYWDVVHSFNTALPGWLVLVARRHIESLDELTEAEAAELGMLVRRASVGLKAVTGCVKTYVMQFAEAAGHNHVHVHVVPRMSDLPAEYRGANIFGYLGVPEEQRVSDAAMDALAVQLQPFFRA